MCRISALPASRPGIPSAPYASTFSAAGRPLAPRVAAAVLQETRSGGHHVRRGRPSISRRPEGGVQVLCVPADARCVRSW